MTTADAIKQLQTEHDLIATERDLDGSQFAPALLEALAMAIEVINAVFSCRPKQKRIRIWHSLRSGISIDIC